MANAVRQLKSEAPAGPIDGVKFVNAVYADRMKPGRFKSSSAQVQAGALGTRKLLTVLSQIGRGLGEDSFEGGERPNAFRMSPQAARGRIEALKADKAWGARFLSGGADEKAEWNRLQRLANP